MTALRVILTRMQASPPATADPATTGELAERLLALWKYVAREAGGEFADLLEELDLSLAQRQDARGAQRARDLAVGEGALDVARLLARQLEPRGRRARAPRPARAPRGRARPPRQAPDRHRRRAARRSRASTACACAASSASPRTSPPTSATASPRRSTACRHPPDPPADRQDAPHGLRPSRPARRQPPLVDARRDVLRAVHDHARQHGRERRAAVDPARPRRLARRTSSGRSTPTR